ncbi:MAG: hypothetical protein Q9181_000257 [Wetmoreana brouardii]
MAFEPRSSSRDGNQSNFEVDLEAVLKPTLLIAVQSSPTTENGTSNEGEIPDTGMDELSDGSVEESPPRALTWPTINDVHRVLRPLQEEADRVGKQVEQFAETLDRHSTDKRAKPRRDCTNALRLVDGYRKIARGTVEYLREIHAPEKQKRLSETWQSKVQNHFAASNYSKKQSRDSTNFTTIDDLDRWEQEEQTWHLFGLMLEVEYPPSHSNQQPKPFEERHVRPSKESGVHQYSSENKVWSHFLAHDDQAWERHTVVEWLKMCASDSGQDIETIFQDLETSADRGSGLWAHSWLYTKEAIKGQKRLRSWPQALAPDSPGIDASLRNASQTISLVTQLDPDAVTRQDRGLEKQDENFERATWLACWEMVRRGKDWEFLRQWCRERVENWRAITMRGDPRHHVTKDDKFDKDPGPAAGCQSRALWRKSCALAARTGVMDRYEAAVYGVLSGYLPSVLKVCITWNDHLFAHYNSYLLRAFDHFVANNLPDRIQRGLQDRNGTFKFSMTGGRRSQSGNQLVEKMKGVKSVSREANEPFKLLQGCLVGKSFDNFARSHGLQLARQQERNRRISKEPPQTESATPGDDETAPIRLDDYQITRIVTHMLLIYQELGPSRVNNGHDYGSETFVDAYVDFLSGAGKQQLLPLYASRLSPQRAVSCLGRQLPLIVERGERQTMMQLMKQYDIDVPGVLNKQLQIIISERKPEGHEGDETTGFPTLVILNEKKQGEMRTIRDGFMGDGITDDQHDLINGFEWYLLLDGYWEQTLATGALLYKYFLSKAFQMAVKLFN